MSIADTNRLTRPYINMKGRNVLDLSKSENIGATLAAEILACVERTQLFIQTELPNLLILNNTQFNSLVNSEDMLSTEGTTDKIYLTKFNAMDVEISDKK